MNYRESGLTTRQEVFLRRLGEARIRLLNSFAGLDVERLSSEHVTGSWTVKDILGHIVDWDEEIRADIELILQGQHPGYWRQIAGKDDFDEWNQRWVAQRSECTWAEICSSVDRVYRETVELILRLRPRDFRKRGITPWKQAAVDRPALPTTADTESIETLVTYLWRHINQHARMIENWRRRCQGAPPPSTG